MNILFASRRPTYPFFLGGAEKSFYELAAALARNGHSVYIVGDYISNVGLAGHFFSTAEVEYSRWYELEIDFLDKKLPRLLRLEMAGPGGMYILHNFLPDLMPALEDLIPSAKPDIICTQLEGATEVLMVARNWKIPVLHFVRDVHNPMNFFALGLQPPLIGTMLCIANSDFVGNYVRDHFKVDPMTVYPMITFEADIPRSSAGDRKRILFVNPIPSKGGDVMYEVAKELPEYDFEIVPGWGKECDQQWKDLPNTIPQYWPVADMMHVMARADLLVFPAQKSEAFGRTGIEAQLSGVPVIASKHSGIQESLAESAILVEDYQDPKAWIKAIRHLFTTPGETERLIAAGKANAARFSEQRVLDLFYKAVDVAKAKAPEAPVLP